MQKVDAIRAMLDGKKVRQTGWREGHYIYFDGSFFLDSGQNMITLNVFPSVMHWELYGEPKQEMEI